MTTITFQISVNQRFVGKVPKDASKDVWAKFNGDFQTFTHNLDSLAADINAGHAITAVLNGYRRRESFVSAQHLGLDFDTEDERSTLDALQANPFIARYGALLYTSSSHTPEKPRARVLFILEEPIIDADQYAQMATALIRKYGIADEHCKDPVRIWFGSKDCEYRTLGNVLPMEVVEREIIAPYLDELEKRRSNARRAWQGSNDVKLEEVAEALRYIPEWGTYDDWLHTLMAVHSVYPGPEGVALCEDWSPGYPGEIEYRFRSFKRDGIGIGTLFHIAKQYGYQSKNGSQYSSFDSVSYSAPSIVETTENQPSQTRWSVAELLDTEFPEPRWAIPGIIPEGLFILGGRPKVGKSFLMLQAAWAIGTGGYFLGQQVEQGNVLFIALEDSPRRLQGRIRDMGIPKNAAIEFETSWPPLHKGGLDKLLIEIERDRYRMIVIDTLSRSVPGVDQKDETAIGPIFDHLQRMAINRSVAVGSLDHTRKPNGIANDPIDDIMNSTAKTAIADVILALYKEQGKAGAVLKGRGREMGDIDLKLEWDANTRCWQSLGNAGEIALTERRNEIIDALQELGKTQAPTVARYIGKDRSNTTKRLNDLANNGLVHREAIGNSVFYWIEEDEN